MSSDPKRSRKFKRKYGRTYVQSKLHGEVSKAFEEFQKRHGITPRSKKAARKDWNFPGQGGEEYPFI